MGTPLLAAALERPATSCVITLCVLVWYYLNKHGLGYEHVGVSYKKCVVERQLWRCVTASVSHVSLIHLVFNMSSLWSLGVVETMGSEAGGKTGGEWGSAFYVRYTVVMLVGTMAVVLGVTHVLVKRFNLERFENVTSVGYSCVVFAWMTVFAVKHPTHAFALGPVNLPVNLAPFGSLVFTALVVPKASFIGHLSGIFVGYLVAWDLFVWVNDFVCCLLVLGVTLLFIRTLKDTTEVLEPSIRYIQESRVGSAPRSFTIFPNETAAKTFLGAGRRLGGERENPRPGTSRLLGKEVDTL